MDTNDIRVAVTVVSLALFIGIVVWTWNSRRAQGFAEAALLPFADEAPGTPAGDAR